MAPQAEGFEGFIEMFRVSNKNLDDGAVVAVFTQGYFGCFVTAESAKKIRIPRNAKTI